MPSEPDWKLIDMTASEAVDSLCTRRVTAEQYAQAVLAQAESSVCINAYAALNVTKVSPTRCCQMQTCLKRQICQEAGQPHEIAMKNNNDTLHT